MRYLSIQASLHADFLNSCDRVPAIAHRTLHAASLVRVLSSTIIAFRSRALGLELQNVLSGFSSYHPLMSIVGRMKKKRGLSRKVGPATTMATGIPEVVECIASFSAHDTHRSMMWVSGRWRLEAQKFYWKTVEDPEELWNILSPLTDDFRASAYPIHRKILSLIWLFRNSYIPQHWRNTIISRSLRDVSVVYTASGHTQAITS